MTILFKVYSTSRLFNLTLILLKSLSISGGSVIKGFIKDYNCDPRHLSETATEVFFLVNLYVVVMHL